MRLERLPEVRTAGTPGAWVGTMLVLGAAAAAAWLRLGLPLPVCRLREATGVPCATCGSTRMVEALLSGDVAAALAWNPLVFAVLTAVSVWAAYSVARLTLGLPGWRLVLERRERLSAGLLAVSLFAAGWAYVLWYHV